MTLHFLPWESLLVLLLSGGYLWVMWRISLYHQRILRVKSGTVLYPAALVLLALGTGGAMLLPPLSARLAAEVLAGACLALCGVHLAHNMLVK